MSFPRYERYRYSGVEWLGEVPEHWQTRKLGSVAEFRGGGTPAKENLDFWNGEIPWVSPKDMKAEYLDQSEDRITQAGLASSATSLIPLGAVLMVVRSGILKHTIPVAINRVPVTLNQDMKAIVIDHATGRSEFFLRWVQGLNELLLHVWLKQGATVESVEHAYLARTEIPFPPIDEQAAICRFIATETAKIDELIEEQRRLIELLKEKRHAVIAHAVTKGLNRNAVTKDSGMEWVGAIPEHWNGGVLVRIADRIVVGIAEAATHAYADEGIPILRSTNIRAGKIIGDILRVLPEFARERGSKLIGAGDLISVRTGNAGVTAVIPEELDGCQCFTMLITSLQRTAIPEFYCYYMNSDVSMSYFGVEGWGTAQVNISVPILKALPIPIPPTREQREIVAYLDGEVAKLEKLSSEANGTVLLLQERRTALISAAVTGKIDVRAFTAKQVASATKYSSGFAHQLLAAEIIDRCNSQRMGRIKLQKLIHLCEYHGQVSDVQGDYSRKAAGPFDAKAMVGVRLGLKKQRWFEEVKEGERYVYQPLEKRGEHKKYLAQWQIEMVRIDDVLNLLGNAKTKQCEIVSTLYAAWNDLLIDQQAINDAAILHEASSAERWHKSKEQIAPEAWKAALQWMKDKGLVPVGYGKHTRHTAGQIEATSEIAHEPA